MKPTSTLNPSESLPLGTTVPFRDVEWKISNEVGKNYRLSRALKSEKEGEIREDHCTLPKSRVHQILSPPVASTLPGEPVLEGGPVTFINVTPPTHVIPPEGVK